VEDVQLPSTFDGLHAAGMLVVQVEATAYHEARFAGQVRQYREKFRALLETGMKVPAIDYSQALRQCRLFRRQMEMLITEFDALLMPVAGAPAPKGLTSTGDPTFCAPWSFAGVPAMALPSGIAGDGLPLGIQLVGAPFKEADLLATARWCEDILGFKAKPRACYAV
jgi:Asp-tRNA(Asn)/Glu-tRNA(Gln) amidotransferase A subunit family amidase